MSQPIDISPQAKKTVKELLQRYVPGVTVWAYGSRVKWTARPDSDLDLVVFADQGQQRNVADLREAFEESNLPFRVDVFVWDEVPEKFREEIREGYVVVVEGKAVGNGWHDTTLGEVIELKRGYDLPQRSRQPGHIPIVSSSGISGTHNEAKVTGPGVVTGRYGTIGEVFWIDDDFWPLNTTLYVRDFKGNDRRFVSYFLRTIDYLSYSDKAAVPGVNRNHLHKAPVRIPSLKQQKTIAIILSTLDKKIELNRQINKTLEAMAQAIFKSWFVDFDPVKAKQAAKALGRDPERAAMSALSGKLRVPKNPADLSVEDLTKAEAELDQLGEEEREQLEQTAALFPDGFIESELGLIPEGWKIAPLVDACDIISGGTPKTSVEAYWNGSIPWASAKDVSQCSETFLISTERSITAEGLMNSAAKLIEPDATVVVARGATTGRMTMFGKQIAMNQTCYGLRAKNGAHFFLYCLCQSFLPQIVHAGHGSVFNTITTSTFRQSKVSIPNDSVALLFHHLTTPLYRSIQSHIEERFLLVQLRNVLLPKLLSGELSPCEAEAQTEKALP